jgi:lipid-A-disaccharide synthase-like uncharacterized protein
MKNSILDVTRVPLPRIERRRFHGTFRSGAGVPLLFGLSLALMLATEFYDFTFLGYQFTGWAWVLISVASLFRLFSHSNRIRFPFWIWLPWSAFVLIRTFAGYEYAWQSTCQILCPTLAGLAASTYSYSGDRLLVVAKTIRAAYYICLIGIVLIVIPFSLRDIDNSGWATGAVSLLFFQAWFLAQYLLNGKKKRDLILYLSAVAVPVLGANRGPLIASVALVVFAVVPISVRRRVAIAATAIVLGILVLYAPKVQRKMFYSGHGTLADLRLDNPNLQTNGRAAMWKCLEEGSTEAPWLGHGGNADRTRLLQAGFSMYLPHNDWLRLRFDYGFIGLALYTATLLTQLLHARHKFQTTLPAGIKAMVGAGLTCLVPYAVVMYTDNVLIYCQYFTVPMMLLMGAAYSARRSRDAVIRRTRRPFQQPAPSLSFVK